MTRLTMQHTTRGSHRSVASTGRLIDGVKLQAFCNRVGFALCAGIAQRYSEVNYSDLLRIWPTELAKLVYTLFVQLCVLAKDGRFEPPSALLSRDV